MLRFLTSNAALSTHSHTHTHTHTLTILIMSPALSNHGQEGGRGRKGKGSVPSFAIERMHAHTHMLIKTRTHARTHADNLGKEVTDKGLVD